jgi:hypothetical protein
MLREYQCLDCGGSDAYRSRRRTFLENYILPFLLLKPVRCTNCFRRSYVSVFTAARERESGNNFPQPADLVEQPKIETGERNFGQVKAIAVKKGRGRNALAGLREMGTLRCDACGEEFVIGHPPQIADKKTAERQAHWLEKLLAEDHDREKKHAERIELRGQAA